MSSVATRTVVPAHPERLFIGGEWVEPSSTATIDVIDPTTEELFFRVAQADATDMARAVAAARDAFDDGPWPRLSHAERAEHLRALAAGLRERAEDIAQISPRQSGILYPDALAAPQRAAWGLEMYADQATTFPWEEEVPPSRGGGYGLLVREPVGVVGAIVAWNGPLGGFTHKAGPALIAGCPVVLKLSPEAPGEGYVVAEIAESIGLPPGVLNVVTADREVSEALVRDPRVDKVTITGSTVAGRRVGAICAERVARCTLELGGKSAAIVLDDADIMTAARTLALSECRLTGQVCSSLTRVIVGRDRHDEMLDAIAGIFSSVRLGDPFDTETGMGPLTTARHRDRVEGYIAKGIADGATLAAGGRRPSSLDRGWFLEPTVFGNVDPASTIAQEEIFGPVLAVIAADDEQHAIDIANGTIYGLNASVFTPDADRAGAVARKLQSGTVGHNAWRTDFGMAFGGFKQSGIGREGGSEGILPFVEVKTIILEEPPSNARS